MIKSGIDPFDIVLFTFTNKAANELKVRLENFIGADANSLTVGTYHSVCLRLLKRYCKAIGFSSNFTIYDSDDSCAILKDITKDTNIDYKVVQNYISSKKNTMTSPRQAIEESLNSYEEQLAEFYKQYQDTLIKRDAMDFDDLIYNTIKLFRLNPDILDKVNKRFKYIISDESHDSCPRDLELIELLGGNLKNICMIFDEDQSIYGFRGSDVDALFEFKDKFKPREFLLEQNYRCSKNILEASKELIKCNDHQIDKNIFTNNDDGMKPIYFEEATQDDESLRALKLILLLNKKYNIAFKDMAVLYRMNYMSRTIEDRLLKANIPYDIVGSCPFYARKEIKDILSYVRIIVNPKDYEAFKRVVNLPKRGIGDTSLEKIKIEAEKYDNNFIKTCKNIDSLKGKAKQGVKDFAKTIDELVETIEENSVLDLIEMILLKTDYRNLLIATEKEDVIEDKMQNLNELINIASNFNDINEFIDSLSLNHIDEDEENSDKIQMMSMHSSKGLEFKAVIIIGVAERTNPHWKAETKKELQEERRLFYVAMTRAKEYLFITRSKLVLSRGCQNGTRPSRFIKEINDKMTNYNEEKGN